MKKNVFAVMMVIVMLVIFTATCMNSIGRTEERDLYSYMDDERVTVDQAGDNNAYISVIKISDKYVGYAAVIEGDTHSLVTASINSLVPGGNSWSVARIIDRYDHAVRKELDKECAEFIWDCLDSL